MTALRHSDHRPGRRTAAMRVAVAALVTLVAACGDKAPSGTAGSLTPLTVEQATTLAGALFDNYDHKGAHVQLAALLPDRTQLNIDAQVDFVNGMGHGTVAGQGIDAGVAEVVWDGANIAERRVDLEQFGGAAAAGITWVSRPLNPEARHLDGMLAVMLKLAAAQRDNPQLVSQKPGAGFVRDDVLRGDDVQIMAASTNSQYWINTEGTMLRFESNDATTQRTIVIDLFERMPVTVTVPEHIDISAVAQWYPVSAG